jgi:hypothetical protein
MLSYSTHFNLNPKMRVGRRQLHPANAGRYADHPLERIGGRAAGVVSVRIGGRAIRIGDRGQAIKTVVGEGAGNAARIGASADLSACLASQNIPPMIFPVLASRRYLLGESTK